MTNLHDKSLGIKSQQLKTVDRQIELLRVERETLVTDIAVLKRANEIENDLQDAKNVPDGKISNVDTNAERTKKIKAVLTERNDEISIKETEKILGLSKMAAKAWVSYQVTKKGKKCPWEFGKNKSWIRLKNPDMQKFADLFKTGVSTPLGS